MKYLRFQTAGDSFTSDLFSVDGDFFNGSPHREEAFVASWKAALEAAYGVRLSPVMGESDPAEGAGPLLENPNAIEKRELAAAQAAAAEHEAAIQAELRAMAEERLAGG